MRRVFLVAVAAAGAAAAPHANAKSSPTVRPTQALAVLLYSHTAVSSLHPHPAMVSMVDGSRPITGEQTVLPVLGHATAAGGVRWLRVMLPGRPNGRQGWITQRGTVLATTSWHIVVRTSTRRVLVYGHGQLKRSFAAVVGKPSTPTPTGQFFVEESVRMLPGSAGAPFALALSARSNVLQEFDGGPGQIAIHGLQNLGGIPGTAISHGCIRLDTQAITWLANTIRPGTPVTITH